MQIFKTNPAMPTPSRATLDSAGFDLYADIDEPLLLPQGASFLIPTGIMVAIPRGYGGFLLPRSGKGSKGMMLKNTMGTIDSDYRGIVYANTRNYEVKDLIIEPMERFCQLVIVKLYEGDTEVVDSEGELSATERGHGGFGSTGHK